jgi:hypothetical protein
MSSDARKKAEEFKEATEAKIRDLITEFTEGLISREQFHAVYERYNGRLQIANEALMTGIPEAVEIAKGGPPTVAVKSASMGRALGVLIYHYGSSLILETLGEFDVPVNKLSPVLNELSMQVDANEHVESRVERLEGRRWLLYNPGRYTVAVTLFLNEPSQMQTREIVRLHHDFEVANATSLKHESVDSNKLAYPFLVFVKKKFGGPGSG